MPESTTWSVAVTAKAPPVIAKAFIAHHLQLGASEIFIFFDDPLDPAYDLVAGMQRVHAVRCDAAHWQAATAPGVAHWKPESRERPIGLQERQCVNAGIAKLRCSATWICHIDIDEFLLPRTSVRHTLATVPGVADAVRLHVCENVYGSFPRSYADVFRGPFKKALPAGQDGTVAAALLYGDEGAHLSRGMQGYHQGKLFVRAAADCNIFTKSALYRTPRKLSHRLQDRKLALWTSVRVMPYQQEETLLLHFFNMGFRDWCSKHLKRFDSTQGGSKDESGQARWVAFKDAAEHSHEALSGVFENLNMLSTEQARTLQSLGALVEARLDLESSVEAVFGPGDHGFDALLPEMPFAEIRETLAGFEAGRATAAS